MMTAIETYVQRGKHTVTRWIGIPWVSALGKHALYALGGLILSGISLANRCQPVTMGMVCALSGWPAVAAAAGSMAGYLIFWGSAGYQGLLWVGCGLIAALALGKRRILDDSPLLMSALGALTVSASGLAFQILLEDTTSVPVYLLRVALGMGSVKLFELVRERRDPLADWLAAAMGVLGLCQIIPFGMSLGLPAAGLLAVAAPLPGAALAGLALDLARVTVTPMTAVLCLSYLVRALPFREKRLQFAVPGAVYLLVMGLSGQRDYVPFVGLLIGGGLGILAPPVPELTRRRGETGLAQVRLELMASCLTQTQQLLTEDPENFVDEEAILHRVRDRACGACPHRKTCRERNESLPTSLLHSAHADISSLPVGCRKPGRLMLELRRGQEQLRNIRADRERQGEYRSAVAQQYRFLASFLQQQSDLLPRRAETLRQRFCPEVAVRAAGKEAANGDRCLSFAGPGCRYYVLLCDGMGTGAGAAREGQTAAELLRKMLTAGFPPEHALRSLNSLLALRGKGAAVTVDLAQIQLDSGRVAVYKWGAAPSYLLHSGATEKIGTASPPPGLSVTEGRETVDRLSLRRGEVLILTSDGVDGEVALRRLGEISAQPPGELAAKILEQGVRGGEDDATVAAIRLTPGTSMTS